MKLLDGHKWVYWFHILVGAPLLMIIPLMFLKDGKIDKDTLHNWFYVLIAVGIGMIFYHGLKLMNSFGYMTY